MHKEPIQQLIAQQLSAIGGDNASPRFRLRFTATTRALLQDKDILVHLSSPANLDLASRVLAEQIKVALFQTAPYFEMDSFAESILFGVCKSLFVDVKRGCGITDIERKHFQRYRSWLELLYGKKKQRRPTGDTVPPVYTEYAAELQLQVLGLNVPALKTPLLDIGCGAHGNLVSRLRNQGVPAVGLDRVADDSLPHFIQDFWWDFAFEKGTWGTITAHLSFSTHFLRAHLLRSAFSVRYAKLYLSILESLQRGGSFHYAPSLPFIEQWLPAERFNVKHTTVNDAFGATIITKK